MQLTAEQGPLPFDTHLVVQYQGNVLLHEDYDVLHPPSENQDVCCRVGEPVSGKLPSVPCTPVSSPRRDGSVPADGSRSDASASQEAGTTSRQDASDGEAGGSKADVVSSEPRRDSGTNIKGGPAALLCELWTGGLTTVIAVGTGYPQLRHDLQPDPNPCAIGLFFTRDIRIVWSQRDGGE